MFDTIDADRLRIYAQIDTNEDDEKIEALRDAAFEYMERYMGRELELKERTERHEARGCILLRAWPTEGTASVTVDGAQLGEGDFILDAEQGILTLTRPAAERNAEITYTGGYSDSALPGPMIAACAMIVSGLLTAAANGGQQITYQALDGYQVTYASKYASGESLEMISPAAAIMLKPYCDRRVMR